ncbi:MULTISPECIES: cell division protein ZipA [unclassified Alteromonas]|uniref:cell division protein ZipA n=1 Tax=unclassified Alteromonas TaxID=2614992 RepID=UPI000509D01B|nr:MULTISPECIES: cell division protein ZipA [unclassified Alteromonas]
MEDELRLFLLLGGSVFIIGVLAHGIWKIRKNSKPERKERLEPRQWNESQDSDVESDESSENGGFDELGVGSVRVIGGNRSYHGDDADETRFNSDDEHTLSGGDPSSDDSSTFADDADRKSLAENRAQGADYPSGDASGNASESANSVNIEQEDDDAQEQRSTLYGSVITNPKPHLQGQSRSSSDTAPVQNDNIADFPEPPGFLLKESEASSHGSQANEQSDGENESSVSLSDSTSSANTSAQHNPSESADHTADAGNIASESKKYQRSEVPKATSTLYVDATKEETSETSTLENGILENSDSESKVVEGQFDKTAAPQRVEPTFSGSLREKGENERVASHHDELAGERKRFSKTKRTKPAARKREEPNFGDDQMRIDFDDNDNQSANQAASNETSDAAAQEVLVLNVRAKNDLPISGAALLPMLLTLGFKFGDQDIFHRHVNSNGKGPVLFSLANMFKPGVFDIDNLENFDTQGISLFMILPIEGDPHQVFNMMHNAARKLADEFDAQVLDGRRSVLTKQGLQQYVEKIREFERKRMISRS